MEREKLIANRYFIENWQRDRIGRGGAGNVYRAMDTANHQTVAIKHLKPELVAGDSRIVSRFEREGEALRRLNHPNIVSMWNSITEDEEHYLVMEYVSGGSLADLIQDQGALPIEQVLRISLELADALTRAHHLDIIHRDIKPANVLLAEDGTPRLTDFGVARMGDRERITDTGILAGTYAYLSPEAIEGEELDSRADIWSFGILLYEMLTGRAPFQEPNLSATLIAILSKPVPNLAQFRPDVPESLANLIYQMLKKERDQRLGSIRLIGAQLEAIMVGLERKPAEPSRFETTPAGEEYPVIGPRHNLPSPVTPFIGREAEIEEVIAVLNDPDCRLLTLVGPGGIGKTRLSIAAAQKIADNYRHGVRFVSLAAVSAPDFLPTTIAETLGLAYFNDQEPLAQIKKYLQEKEMLLVLDNFEHLVEGAALVSELLVSAQRLQILVTSREALNLWEEWTRPVRGMAYPEDVQVTELAPYSAVLLFISRAKRVLGRFDLQAELPHIIRICQLVDGMPLGIELAATWLRVLTPAQIATEVEKNYDFLATNMRNIAKRHRSIRAVFDYSWALMSAEEQRTFRCLAVFQGGFRRRAAATVANATLLTLTNLVNKSLLYEGETHTTDTPTMEDGRYTMHELLKQYAEEKLGVQADERHRMEARHAAFYTRFLRRQEPRLRGGQQKEALEAISQDLDNVRQAWKWSVRQLPVEPQAGQQLIDAAASLIIFYETRGMVIEGREMLQAALDALNGVPSPNGGIAQRNTYLHALARIQGGLGLMLYRMNRYNQGADYLRESEGILRDLIVVPDIDAGTRLEAKRDLILVLTYLSFAIARTARQQLGREMILEAIALSKAIEDRWSLVRATNGLAVLTTSFQEQKRLFKKALRMAQEIGDRILATRILLNLSGYTNTPEDSFAYAAEIYAIYQEIRNPAALVTAHIQYGVAAARVGDMRRAREDLERSLQVALEYGLYDYIEVIYFNLARFSQASGDDDQALHCYTELLRLSQETRDPEQIVKAIRHLGSHLMEQGEFEPAKRYYKQALCVYEQISNMRQRAEALDALGNFALTLGKYNLAHNHFQDAYTYFQEVEDNVGAGWAVANFGHIAFKLGDFQTAEQKYAESLVMFGSGHYPWSIADLRRCQGRVAFALQQDESALSFFQEGLRALSDVWPAGSELEILTDWVPLLIRAGDKEKALVVLNVINRHPRFVPGLMDKEILDRASRLQAELVAYLPAGTVAAAELEAVGVSLSSLVAEILAMPVPPGQGVATP
jgi:predicted ATPase/Tfp pilus assembly protein PilF